MNCDGRVVIWFSCGAASAVAAKLAVKKYPDAHVVYCDLSSAEHVDNHRFLLDVERWIGKPIELIKSKKYTSVDDVFERARYMSGVAGARCTLEMKKIPRHDYQLPNDLHIFGLTYDEKDRIDRFEMNNKDLELEWILYEGGYTKDQCFGILKWEGIRLPDLYSESEEFSHNNCIGCVKSQRPAYWDVIRKLYPDVFKRRCEQSRRIGCRLVKYHGVRIFLDELPDPITDKGALENIECGVICIQEFKQEIYEQQQPELFETE